MGVTRAKHTCAICATSRRPVGLPKQDADGWAVYRWGQPDPLLSGLATKGEAMKALWALKHGWSSITVRFMRGHTAKVDLRISI